MTKQTQKVNYVGPFLTMVLLFFIVGFLTVVFQQFQNPLQTAFLSNAKAIENTLAVLVTFSWFLAYPLTGGLASKWVDRYGYKKTLVRALLIMVGGLLITASSAWLHNRYGVAVPLGTYEIPLGFFIFLFGSYVVGAAATIMQVVINPYLAASKVKGTTAVQRITIGGSLNSIGTTIAPLFVSGVVFGGMAMANIQITQVIIPFLTLALVILTVSLVVNKLTLPNIEGTTNATGAKLTRSIWSFRHLTLGVIGIFFYVGVEVAIGANIGMYAKSPLLAGGSFAQKAALMASLYWGGMLVGRLVGSTLNKISAQTQLLVTSIVSTLLVIGSILLGNPWLLVLVGLMHSIMWSAIFSLAVTDLGAYTSKGSGALMIGVVGGAILPLLQGMLADAMGGDWTWTWLLVVVGELYLLYYALWGYKVVQKP